MQYQGRKLRHELKYHIGMKEYGILSSRLRPVMQLDQYHRENKSYFIRSLYFDDVFDSALYEKSAGDYLRSKYRIRIYNMSEEVIKLECKMKFGQYISKESQTISMEEYHAIMNQDIGMLKNAAGLKQNFYRQMKEHALRPKVIVDYEREAYMMVAGDVRITFDQSLKVGFNTNDIFSTNVVTYNVYDIGAMILEVKYDAFLPEHVRMLLDNCVTQYRQAISKYVICRVAKGNIY